MRYADFAVTPSARTPSILIADDQQDVLESLRLLLKAEGYFLETADSPAEAVAAAGGDDAEDFLAVKRAVAAKVRSRVPADRIAAEAIAIALNVAGMAFLSQHIGDLENLET